MPSRRSTLIAGTTALALALAGCAGGASQPPTTASTPSSTVTFRSWSPIEQTTKQMIEAFTAENPGSTIDAAIFNYPEYLVDLQTRAGSNTLPDVMGLQPGALLGGWLAPPAQPAIASAIAVAPAIRAPLRESIVLVLPHFGVCPLLQ